jgi:hypothetical protein
MISDQPGITAGAVASLLHGLATTLEPHRGLNERYVHHAFSHWLQAEYPCLNLAAPHHTLLLHPEWPTCKKATGVGYAKYRKTNGCYVPKDVKGDDGDSGFIDFAIGPYANPEIGVEFCLKYGWPDEDVTYDFLKILDSRNPFRAGFSHTLVLRDNNLTRGASRQDLEEHINRARRQAVERLGEIGCAANRDVHLIVSEIATHERRHWHYDLGCNAFIDGLV